MYLLAKPLPRLFSLSAVCPIYYPFPQVAVDGIFAFKFFDNVSKATLALKKF